MDDYSDLFAEHVDGPVYTDLRSLPVRDIRWLDPHLLPWGELVTMNADGDTGKGLFACYQAARISRTGGLVVFAAAEDAFETVLKPRLLAARANLDYVRCVSWQRRGASDALRIPDDIPELERSLLGMGASMLVIDPLLSHLSASTDSYRDHEVKLALQPLLGLAQRTGCLVLGNHHFAKNKSYGLRNAVMGSAGFVNTPRVALSMTYDDVDPNVRVVNVIKSNLGPKEERSYRVLTASVEGLREEQPVMVDEGMSVGMVDALLGRASGRNAWDG